MGLEVACDVGEGVGAALVMFVVRVQDELFVLVLLQDVGVLGLREQGRGGGL